MFDEIVFDIIKNLKPSERGELEITDVNNFYIKRKILEYDILNGYWTDAGTFESLFKASELVKRNYKKLTKSLHKKNYEDVSQVHGTSSYIFFLKAEYIFP